MTRPHSQHTENYITCKFDENDAIEVLLYSQSNDNKLAKSRIFDEMFEKNLHLLTNKNSVLAAKFLGA